MTVSASYFDDMYARSSEGQRQPRRYADKPFLARLVAAPTCG